MIETNFMHAQKKGSRMLLNEKTMESVGDIVTNEQDTNLGVEDAKYSHGYYHGHGHGHRHHGGHCHHC